jgi:hypothetical protein
MTDSEQSQPRQPSSGEVDHARGRSASNGRSSKPAPDGETPLPAPGREDPQPGLETQRQLQGLEAEKAVVRWMNAVADEAQAKADEAKHRAEKEPKRQRMSLWERGIRYGLLTLLTLAAIGLEVALFVVSPWLFSLSLLIAGIAAVKQFGGNEEGGSRDDEREGDP